MAARRPTSLRQTATPRDRLIARALALPGAWIDHPWGEVAVKVGKRVFVFAGSQPDRISLSLKLPHSCGAALMLPFASPTGYGLGASGWVTVRFGPDEDVPEGLIAEWIDESWRAVAPKKLVRASIPAASPPGAGRRRTRRPAGG